jgi:hypothetical protein
MVLCIFSHYFMYLYSEDTIESGEGEPTAGRSFHTIFRWEKIKCVSSNRAQVREGGGGGGGVFVIEYTLAEPRNYKTKMIR